MAKFLQKIKARKLRSRGESINVIAKRIRVSKSSVSRWCHDIELSKEQIAKLEKRMVMGSYTGRLKGARLQFERRKKQITQLQQEGADLLGGLSDRDLLLVGAGLYWGEGTKKDKVRITNSNPAIIKFAIHWFSKVWGISKEDFTLHVIINRIHKDRVSIVEKHWSELTSISMDQFIKTTLIKTKTKKIYKNFENYYGTVNVTVRRGGNLHPKIMGLISKISEVMPG